MFCTGYEHIQLSFVRTSKLVLWNVAKNIVALDQDTVECKEVMKNVCMCI